MSDIFFLAIGWIHTIAAVAWVGGGIFYWVVLRPALRGAEAPALVNRLAGPEFSQLVALAMWVLVLTGGILAFNRLAQESGTVTYVSVLGVKVALAAWMFFLVIGRGRGREPGPPRRGLGAAVNALGHVNTTVALGIIVFLLSDILVYIVERNLGT